jgi:hypothetical protein
VREKERISKIIYVPVLEHSLFNLRIITPEKKGDACKSAHFHFREREEEIKVDVGKEFVSENKRVYIPPSFPHGPWVGSL